MSRAQQEELLKGKQKTFAEHIWNSKEGEFLGRTGLSWAKIFIFYNIYYGFLAGFFSLCMFIFYQTLDTQFWPKYIPGDGQSILRNPSLGFRPHARPYDVESTLIWYNSSNDRDIRHWVESLNNFIMRYEGADYYDDGSSVKDCSESNGAGLGEVCKFDYQLLGDKCNKAENWGYSRSNTPCVILKMNKMIGWVPDVYEYIEELPDHMPNDLKDHIKQKTEDNGGSIPRMVWVSCKGENPADEEFLGKVEYTPWQGFPAYYFPYLNVPGYLPPIVAVRFVNPASHVLINIECKAWANNIFHYRKERLGLVHFQILLEHK